MIFAKTALLKAIKDGDIKIEPFDEDSVGAGSIDLRLGNIFRTFKRQDEPILATEKIDARNYSELVELGENEVLELKPGETVLGVTVEKVILSENIAGWIEGRSRFARIGLGVHITSGFIQPGSSNHQVLEITNLGPNQINLIPDVRICQIVFEKCQGKAKYKGDFAKQDKP